MGLMDKLLGRGKQVAGQAAGVGKDLAGHAADKGKDLAGDAYGKSKQVAGAGLGVAGGAMQAAGEKLAGQDEPPATSEALATPDEAAEPAAEATES